MYLSLIKLQPLQNRAQCWKFAFSQPLTKQTCASEYNRALLGCSVKRCSFGTRCLILAPGLFLPPPSRDAYCFKSALSPPLSPSLSPSIFRLGSRNIKTEPSHHYFPRFLVEQCPGPDIKESREFHLAELSAFLGCGSVLKILYPHKAGALLSCKRARLKVKLPHQSTDASRGNESARHPSRGYQI